MSSTPANPDPLRIFIVEDHQDTAKYLRMYLESVGHEVCEARTIATALSEIPRSGCGVLISDLGLPDGTGWDLMQALRSQQLAHPPFTIAMSGYGSIVDKQKSSAAGFRHHILKPIDIDEMDTLLAEAARELAR